jgi:hypothetical protein
MSAAARGAWNHAPYVGLAVMLGLSTAPAAQALTIIPAPDCTVDEVDHYGTVELAPGIYFTNTHAHGDRLAHDWLVICESGQAVRATENTWEGIDFYTLAAKLVVSDQTYTLNDVAKLAREIGYDARVMPFATGSCVCNEGQ